MSFDHRIPECTDPMGKHFRMPKRDDITFHREKAVMTKRTFEMLCDYSTTNPSGVYPGKMWKALGWEWAQGPNGGYRKDTGVAYLRWYGPKHIHKGHEVCTVEQAVIDVANP